MKMKQKLLFIMFYFLHHFLFSFLQILTFADSLIHPLTMPSGNITFPARVQIMGLTVHEKGKFEQSVQGLGPTPTLSFTHHQSKRDLWIAGACGEDAGLIRKILENVQDYVKSRGFEAGKS